MAKTRRVFQVSDLARDDLKEIRRYTVKQFGKETAQAYSRLLTQALQDIKVDPECIGSQKRTDIGAGFRSYHISLSRERSIPKIGKPRHIVLYFMIDETAIVISRILHESQDIIRHIPQTPQG